MTFSLRGEQFGCLRKPIAAVCSLLMWLGLACLTPGAAAQLQVGQPIDFGSTAVGNPITLVVVFSATGSTTITSSSVLTDGATGQDFTLGSTNCTGTIAQNQTCNASVTFTPTRVGVRRGVLLLYGSSNQIVSEVFLHGIGLGGAFAFAPANVTALTAAPGLTPATFTSGSSVQDGNGNLYFTDVQNQRILKQSTTGTITLVTALPVSARSSIAIGPDGTLFVSAQNAVYAFMPGGTPTPINTGSITLVSPSGLGVDSIGDLYIADASTGTLAKYALNGSGTSAVTLATLTPGLSSPEGLALDSSNNLYVADSGNDRVVEISASTGASTLPVFSGLTLNDPNGITVDPAGTVYVTDTGNHRLVELTVNGVDFALADPNLSLTTPTGVLMKPNGDLIVSDNVLGQVLVPRSIPSLNFPTPTIDGALDTTDGALPLTLQATGNSVAQLVFPMSGTEPTISTNVFAMTSAGTCPSINSGSGYTPLQFTIGDICTYTIDFTPNMVGLNTANFVVNISLPGGTTTYTTTVPLSGTGISSIASFSLVASPSTTTVGVPVSLTLTALNAAGGTATDYVGTVTFTSTDANGVFLGGTTYTFTAADAGVLSIPAASGIQFNQIGTFTVHATDGTYSATSNPVVVKNATTASSFTSSVNPSLPNQSTTLSVTLTSAGPQPTGSVSFYSGTTLLGTATLVNGVASLPASFAAPGTYSLTAVYNGDGNNAAVTAGPLSQKVLNVTTATSFTSSVNPSLPNQNTLLTLTLASSGPAPTGTVQFYSGTTLLGTGTVSGGVVTLTTSFATVGSYALSAVYSGDSNDAAVTATLTQLVVNPVTIALTSSVNPSLKNQQVTLSVTVGSAAGTPTGTVQFYDGTTLLGTATLVNGAVTIPATFTTIGIHTLTAVYSGDANDVGATSAGYAQDVVSPTVATAFTSSVNPSLVNQSTVLTLTLTGTGTGPAPSGTVSFYSGTTLLGTGTVANGVATLTTSFAAIGTYSLTAVYSGDTNNAAVTAGPLTQVVVAPGSVVLTSSVNPSLVGQNTVLTALLGSATATGTVQFYDGTTLLGTVTVAGGAASLTASFSTVGIHTLTAVYSGDANNAGATSAALAQDVMTTTTASSFTSSVNPSQVNQSTTLSLTLTGTSSTPTGTVKFYSGTTLLGTATLSGGVATLPVSFAAVGSYALTAVYSGDTNNAALTAGPLTQVVVALGSVVLTSSVNPSLVGQSTTLTATLGSTSLSGPVTFYNGTTVLGTSSATNGAATLPVSFSTVGLQSLTAVYSGTTSAVYLQDVINTTTAVSLTSSVNPSLVNQSTTLTATLTSASSSITGTVKFYSGTTLIGTGTVSGGVASVPVSFAAAGAYTLTAVYSGDTNNAAVTAGPLTQVVVTTGSVVLTSSVNPSLVGQNTTLTATLGSTTATGTVKFYDGTTLLGTVTVVNGTASLLQSFSTAGIHTLTAVYSGDANNAGATSAAVLQDVVTATTASSFTSSINPSQVNQSTTLSLTLTGTSSTPTGTVKFYSGTTLLGTATLSNGVATLPVSFAAVGSYPLTAVYSGDTNNAALTAGPLTQVVVAAGSVVLTSSVNPSLVGQSTTLTATLGSTSLTGTVTFYNGTTALGTANATNGVATLPVSFSAVGPQSLTAVYAGTTSAVYLQDVVNPTTAAGFTSSVNPSLVGQNTTLTATLTSASSSITGTVKFYSGTTLLGTGTVANGVATLTTSFAAAGSYTLTAVYSGDTSNAAVTAGPLTQVVVNSTGITLTSSVNPVLVGNSTTLTATLSSATANGTITFYNGTTVIGSGTVVNGKVNVPVSFSTAGVQSLTAVYSGDANDAAATSAVLPEDVQNADTATVASSVSPAIVGQAVTLTATIHTAAAGSPTGSVQFFSGTTLLGTGTVSGGTASIQTTFSAIGTLAITCQYAGDNFFEAATCPAISLQVEGSSSLAVVSSLNPSTFGQSVTFTATIMTAGPTPTGQVSFYNGTTLLGTVTLPTGSNVATYSTTALPIGADAIKAVYGGDSNTPAATGTLTQTVLNPATISFPCPVGPLLVNTPVTLTATVTSSGTAPTGTVKFYNGTTLLGTGTLVSGVATISATITAPGAVTLQAVYSGDGNNGAVSSTTCAEQAVDVATIALTSSVNPSLVHQSVTFTAAISASGPTPTGTVKFYSGTTLLGTVNVINGSASLSNAFATAGTYSITAVYSGDNNTQGVTSAPLSQTVLNIATIALTSAVNPVLLDNQDVLTAVVSSTGVTPTGLVTFYFGTAPLGNATLVNGTAVLTVSFPASGTQSLTAVYYGDPVTAPATSGAVAETVGDISVAVAAGTASSKSILAGGTATYSLVLTPLIVGSLPSTVTFSLEGLPKTDTYTFTPASVTAGSGATPFVLTINTPAITGQLHGAPVIPGRRIAPIAVALLLLPAAFMRRRRLATLRKKFGGLLLLLLLAAGATGLTGCISAANSGYYGQTEQTYNLTVVASSGQLSRTTGVTLIVQ